MSILMSATANTLLSFTIGFSLGAVCIAWWMGRESEKQSAEIKDPSETKIVYISGDIETSIVEPTVSDWKKAQSN